MSRKTVRREAFGGDEADQQQPPKRPAAGQKRGSPAEEAVARLILTFGPLIIERFLMPPPAPRASVFDEGDTASLAYNAGFTAGGNEARRSMAAEKCAKCSPCAVCGQRWPAHTGEGHTL